ANVAIHAPQAGKYQQHPRDLSCFHEEARRVVLAFDEFLIALSMGHDCCSSLKRFLNRTDRTYMTYGITRTSSPSATCVTPVVITNSPAFTPLLIATELPYDSPSVTVRKRAMCLPAASSITSTAYAFGSAFDLVIDVNGTTGTSVATPDSLTTIDAIIPGFSKPCGFGIVTSTSNTRLL